MARQKAERTVVMKTVKRATGIPQLQSEGDAFVGLHEWVLVQIALLEETPDVEPLRRARVTLFQKGSWVSRVSRETDHQDHLHFL